MQEGSLFSTPPPAFVICVLINDGHSGVPIVAQWLMNLTRNHEIADSIPSLAQWVKDLALLLLWFGLLSCGFDPWPGNFCNPWAQPNK